jgi:hypothetical protein
MKYAVEIGSGAVLYKPSFIKIGQGIQKLIRGIHRQHGDLIRLLVFFQNKESRLRMNMAPLSSKAQNPCCRASDISHLVHSVICLILHRVNMSPRSLMSLSSQRVVYSLRSLTGLVH